MIVGESLSMFYSPHLSDSVGQRIAAGLNLPAAINETVGSLGGNNRIQHNAEVAAGRILHSGGDVHAADCKAVLLVLHRTGSHGHIGKNIGEIPVVLRYSISSAQVKPLS